MGINPIYLGQEAIKKIQDELAQEFPGIILFDFLSEDHYLELEKAVIRSAYSKQCIPNKFSYGKANIPKKVLHFLHSKEFLEFISRVLGEEITQFESAGCYCFGWKDYTLLHDDLLLDEGVDIILDFTPEWNAQVGGSTVYTHPGKESISLAPSFNSLLLVKRSKALQRYVEYVNHHAEGRRFFVLVSV